MATFSASEKEVLEVAFEAWASCERVVTPGLISMVFPFKYQRKTAASSAVATVLSSPAGRVEAWAAKALAEPADLVTTGTRDARGSSWQIPATSPGLKLGVELGRASEAPLYLKMPLARPNAVLSQVDGQAPWVAARRK